MEAAPYSVELHLHTCYSFLEGASLPEELALRAADLGYKTLAITDHDGLYGAMDFAQTCASLDQLRNPRDEGYGLLVNNQPFMIKPNLVRHIRTFLFLFFLVILFFYKLKMSKFFN